MLAKLWHIRRLLAGLVVTGTLLARGLAQDRNDRETGERCLESLIDWKAVAAMLTSQDVQALDSAYENVAQQSTATDATYALWRYKLRPDGFSVRLMLEAVPRGELDAALLYQVSEGANTHAKNESLRTAMDGLPNDYYYTLGEVIGKTRRGYERYLKLAAILEGDPGELVAVQVVKLWSLDRKRFDAALEGLDARTRQDVCSIFAMEDEPWLKDKLIRRLCPGQREIGHVQGPVKYPGKR